MSRRTLLDLKVAALEAHASQARPLVELVGPATYPEWWRTESFRRPRPGARQIATPSSPALDHYRSGRPAPDGAAQLTGPRPRLLSVPGRNDRQKSTHERSLSRPIAKA